MSYPETCPSCEVSLRGQPIPEQYHDFYSAPFFYYRVIGLSDGDSVYAWRCPDCGHTWPRVKVPEAGFRKCELEVRRG